jgi:hypothetical protein
MTTTTNNSIDDRLWNEIDNCVEESDRGDELALRSLAERLRAEALAGKGNLWYPAGYAYYCLKSRISDIAVQSTCEECFRNAIAFNFDSDLAKVYLAFHNYDLGRDDSAMEFETNINYDRLEETVELRYREVCLCARLRSLGLIDSAARIAEFAEYVGGLTTPDPMPFLLERCLSSFENSDFETPDVRNAIFRLDRAYEFMGQQYFSKGRVKS